jgi:hypothetical protein
VFTVRYALSAYIKQIRFVFKGLIYGGLQTVISIFRQVLCRIYDVTPLYISDIF